MYGPVFPSNVVASTLRVDANSEFVASYTMKPISCGNYYFLVLKAAKVTGPNQSEKAAEIAVPTAPEKSSDYLLPDIEPGGEVKKKRKPAAKSISVPGNEDDSLGIVQPEFGF